MLSNTAQANPLTSCLRFLSRCFQTLGIHTTRPERLRKKYASNHSRFLYIDETLVHYQDEGEGPVLILCHGVLASLHTWDGWVERLKSKYRIIRFDIPGFGLSDPNSQRQLSPEYSEEFLNLFVTALGIEECYLVGNSLGGFISWNYAVTHPERVKKLILIDPIGYEQTLPTVMKLVTSPGIQNIARWIAPKFIVDSGVRKVYGQPGNIHQSVFQRYYDLLSHPGGRDAMVDVFLTFRRYNGHPDVTTKMKTLKIPTLLMWGRDDAWVPVSHVEDWKRDVPHAEAIIYEHAGHIPMEECPELTASDADQFLSRA